MQTVRNMTTPTAAEQRAKAPGYTPRTVRRPAVEKSETLLTLLLFIYTMEITQWETYDGMHKATLFLKS